jgi:hypothetical protein
MTTMLKGRITKIVTVFYNNYQNGYLSYEADDGITIEDAGEWFIVKSDEGETIEAINRIYVASVHMEG